MYSVEASGPIESCDLDLRDPLPEEGRERSRRERRIEPPEEKRLALLGLWPWRTVSDLEGEVGIVEEFLESSGIFISPSAIWLGRDALRNPRGSWASRGVK